jgi:hypothetical protein
MEEIDASVADTKKKKWLTPKQKNWMHGLYSAALVGMVVATHFATVGNSRGFLLGTAETTIAAAVAVGLIVPLIAMRIVEFSKTLSGDRAVIGVMIGTIVLIAGAVPLQLMTLDLNRRMDVTEAYMRGYSAATRVGQLAEKQPQDARKIGNVVGFEILREALGPTLPAAMVDEMDGKIAARWKELGFDKSPDL